DEGPLAPVELDHASLEQVSESELATDFADELFLEIDVEHLQRPPIVLRRGGNSRPALPALDKEPVPRRLLGSAGRGSRHRLRAAPGIVSVSRDACVSLSRLLVRILAAERARVLRLRLELDGFQDVADRLLERLVDDHMIVEVALGELRMRRQKPPLDALRRVVAAASKPLLERLEVRRSDEKGHHAVDRSLAKLPGALDIDVEKHVAPLANAALDVVERRSVEMPVDLGVLGESA